MTALDDWTADAARALGVSDLTADEQRLVLDVAREVAHNVLRPGAPVSAFLLGVAVGRGADLTGAGETLIALARTRTAG